MKFAAKLLLYLLQIVIIPCVVATSRDDFAHIHEIPLKTVIKEAQKSTKDYVAPAAQERLKMANIVRSLLNAISNDLPRPRLRRDLRLDSVNQLASELDFEVIRLKDKSEFYIVLREKKKHQRGGGIYIFRPIKDYKGQTQSMRDKMKPEERDSVDGKHTITIIQAPHSRYDQHTGNIGRLVFENTETFAFFLNTAHRKKGDLAHNENSYFQVITQTVCDYFASASVIQFHGYSSAKHRNVDEEISIILSDGKESFYRKTDFRRTIGRFVKFLGDESVGVFGVNVHQLGGTTNVQARYINGYSDDTFIHVEMSEKLRQDFLRDKSIQTQFIEVFR